MSLVSRPLGAEAGSAVKPSDGRSAVSESQDTDVIVRLAVEALQPNVDNHPEELEEVVDLVVAIQDAEGRD